MTIPSNESYRQIPLSRQLFVSVDEAVFEHLSEWKWSASGKTGGHIYACRWEVRDGKRVAILMHRYILGLHQGDPRKGDHINGDTLNCTGSNLRIVNDTQSAINRRVLKNNSSGYTGVYLCPSHPRPWRAEIRVNNRRINLGYFALREEAVAARIAAATELHGEYRRN